MLLFDARQHRLYSFFTANVHLLYLSLLLHFSSTGYFLLVFCFCVNVGKESSSCSVVVKHCFSRCVIHCESPLLIIVSFCSTFYGYVLCHAQACTIIKRHWFYQDKLFSMHLIGKATKYTAISSVG